MENRPDEAEQRLREDRRLFGRLLGDVVREQAGEAVFETIERIRQTAVGFRRVEVARAELDAQLDALDIEQTLHVVRAFSYFSLLLNIAEDAHRGDAGGPGTFAHALERAREAGATDEALAGARKLQRQAQWRLDFVSAENSMGFHAPQESARLLGEAIDMAHRGRIEALRAK